MRNLTVKLPYKDGDQIIDIQSNYVNEGCMHFFNAQHLYLKLTTIERCYFDYICERMDYYNRIDISPVLRSSFFDHFQKLTDERPPSIKSLTDCEKKLRELKLLLKIKNNGKLHFVNPKYVTKGKEAHRKKALILIAEYSLNGEAEINSIIDRPLANMIKQTRILSE